MKNKVILMYSDLEGTLLREKDSEYGKEELNEFLSQIDKLQQQTGATVQFHLVSPVDESFMDKILKQLDKDIRDYNRTTTDSNHTTVNTVVAAAAYPMEDFTGVNTLGRAYIKRIDHRIIQLKKPVSGRNMSNPAGFGKENYVRTLTEYTKNSSQKELLMSIYCGNGRNDLSASDYIRFQKNGFVICPKNSRRELKARASFVSEHEDLKGIIDGLEKINNEIEKRKIQTVSKESEKNIEDEER